MKITLIGGPGDGEEYDVAKDANLIERKPNNDRDQVLLRMHNREPSQRDRVTYRRSLRTRSLFVYQP